MPQPDYPDRLDSLTSLEPLETAVQQPPYGPAGVLGDEVPLSETFIHSGWRRERRLVYESLRRTNQTASRRDAFASCGSRAFVYATLDENPRFRLAGSACHDRWCLPCAKARSSVLAANILERIAVTRTRFVTLTLVSSDAPLADQLDFLYSAFRQLRKTKTWSKATKGGCAVLELTYNPSREQWHPHLHALTHGSFLPQKDLRAEWWRITKTSNIVDIRLPPSKSHIAKYLAKYAGKPLNNTFVARPDVLDEAIVALKGRRLCLTFGDWRGVSLLQTEDAPETQCIGSLDSITRKALSGDVWAQNVLQQLAGNLAESWTVYVARRLGPQRPEPPPMTQPTFKFAPQPIR
jgi:hypothetical protein